MKKVFYLGALFLLPLGIMAQCPIISGGTATGGRINNVGQSFLMPASGCAGPYFSGIIVDVNEPSDIITGTLVIHTGASAANPLYTQTNVTLSGVGSQTITLSGGTGSLQFTPGNTYTWIFSFSGNLSLLSTNVGIGGESYYNGAFRPAVDYNFEILTSAADPLPVELTYFKATEEAGQTVLSWETASEENNQGFEVEHSSNGYDWEMIDFVEGHGTTWEVQNYTYSHPKPTSGLNYYRLKQVDFDGAFEYTDIQTVDFSEGRTMKIFPNPVSDKLTLQTSGQSDLVVQIFNLNGQTVYENNQTTDSDLSIDLSELPKGMYFLKVTNALTQEVFHQEKIVKQ